ncbi:PREDICTED: uncharacterized protein LOC101309860 [Fragaria vesca subsp. vesca]
MAVVYVVQQWRPYLLGRHFKIFTDHRTIQYFLDQKISTPTQQKWLLKLAGYDYTIHFKAGKNNAGLDTLSRREELGASENKIVERFGSLSALQGISSPAHLFLQDIQKSCLIDPEASIIIVQLQSDASSQPHYKLEGEQLLFKDKIFVLVTDNWRTKIIVEFHNGYNIWGTCCGVFKLHGMPDSVISDRDPVFLSGFWSEFFKAQGTALHKSSAYHPQTDGQTENLNRSLEHYLRCVAGEKPTSWVEALPWAEYWYNTAHHSTIGMTPFQALYSYEPPAIRSYASVLTAVNSVDQALKTRDELLAILKRNLEIAQARMKLQYDRKHVEREFQIGDWVYVKLQPYKQQSVAKRKFHKLSPRYYGPFEVDERIGTVAYKLKLPAAAKIHQVFHVSLLKKKLGSTVTASAHLPPNVDPYNPRWYPAKILEGRMYKKGNVAVTKWLIQWLGSTEEEATWEEAEDIQSRFPDFQDM